MRTVGSHCRASGIAPQLDGLEVFMKRIADGTKTLYCCLRINQTRAQARQTGGTMLELGHETHVSERRASGLEELITN